MGNLCESEVRGAIVKIVDVKHRLVSFLGTSWLLLVAALMSKSVARR